MELQEIDAITVWILLSVFIYLSFLYLIFITEFTSVLSFWLYPLHNQSHVPQLAEALAM